MTKRSAAVALAGVVAFSLSACSGGSSSGDSSKASGSSNAADAPASAGAVNAKDPKRDANADLVIWVDGTAAPVVSKLAAEFAKQNGVKVSVQTATNVRENYNTAFKAGQAPDIIVGAHDWMGELVSNGSVAPVQMSAQTAGGFNPVAMTAAKYNGQTYGVPYAVENMALIRNTAYAPEAPKTLDEMIATGQKAVDSKKATNVLALEMGKVGDAYHAYPFLSGFGGSIFGTKAGGELDANKLMVDSPETLKGANLIAELGKKKVLSTNIDKTNADSLFAGGKAAYAITGPWSLPTYDKAGVKYAVSAMPTVTGGGKMTPFLGVQMFYVSSKAKNSTVAQTFATSFITTEAAQKQLFEIGKRPPALKSAYDAVAKSDPQVAQWAAAGEGAKPMPSIPAMNAVWTPLGQAVADVVSGKSAPEARFKAAQKEIETAIKAGN